MNFDLVDGTNGSISVRVGGKQRTFGIGVKFHSLAQKTDTIQLRHALIGQQQRDRIITRLQLAQGIEGGHAGLGAQNTVAVTIMTAKITLNRSQHLLIVVYGEEYRFCHPSRLLLFSVESI